MFKRGQKCPRLFLQKGWDGGSGFFRVFRGRRSLRMGLRIEAGFPDGRSYRMEIRGSIIGWDSRERGAICEGLYKMYTKGIQKQ